MPSFGVRRLSAALALAVAFLLLPAGFASAEDPSLEPAGHMDVLRGISGARGKVVIVHFFASWCAPCREEIPSLIKLRGEYPEDELEIRGYSVDEDPKAFLAFAREMGFNYPVRLAGETAARVFQVQGIPKTMFYSRRGALAVNHDGYLSEEQLRGAVDKLLER